MINLEQSFDTRFSLQLSPSSLSLRFGRRELSIGLDFKKRPYYVRPLIDCLPGAQTGHVEILLFRKWLMMFSKAKW